MAQLDGNLEKMLAYLAPIGEAGVLSQFGGKSVPAQSGETLENYSQVDEEFFCQVAKSSSVDIHAAAKVAKDAFPTWRDVSGTDRKKILHKIADGIVARAEEIAFCECNDTGQALRLMSKAALRGAEIFRFFGDLAPGVRDGKQRPSATLMNVTTRIPIGPVGVIMAWSMPLMLSTWEIAPALAAGCTVVHKPAEFSPVTARILMEIADGAGLPAGAWNLVNGFGEDAGKALTEHADIKAIAFVGESGTGSNIMKQGTDPLKCTHFELDGKNPVIVFEDAELDRALDAAIFMIYSLNSERCTSSSRLLVQSSIVDEFQEKLAARVKNVRVGHPLNPQTEIGHLIHKMQFDKFCSYFDIAKKDGATIAAGGKAKDGNGWYVEPTPFTGANNDMRIAQEEIFGPDLTAITFDTEEEAFSIANDTQYVLTGYVWTNDLTQAIRFTEKLEAGMIWVNSENVRHLPTPFGDVKASGIGCDGGDWSFDFCMTQKHIGFATGHHRISQLGV